MSKKFSDFEKKFLRRYVKTGFCMSGGTFGKKIFWEFLNFPEIEWKVFFSEFGWMIFGRVVQTAFYVSREIIWRKLIRWKIKFLKFFLGFWTKFFYRVHQNCILRVHSINLQSLKKLWTCSLLIGTFCKKDQATVWKIFV